MNALTEEMIMETVKKHRAAAKRNDDRFRCLVRAAYDDHMIAGHGVQLKHRAYRLLEAYSPVFFDRDGYLKEFADMVFDLDRRLSWLVMRVLERRVNREPSLQLSIDWGDYPQEIAKQMEEAELLAREVEKMLRKEAAEMARREAKQRAILETGQMRLI